MSTDSLIRRKVFTTGMIAEICDVAPRTVAKWFDAGLIKGYCIPGSRDRRIPRENLIKFMHECNMPVEWLHTYERSRQQPAGAA